MLLGAPVRVSKSLMERYSSRLEINVDLDRQVVSFQANKQLPFYRWFKYKEAFSTGFVEYALHHAETLGVRGRVLDPFCGIGTTLFTALGLGLSSVGIEMLEPALFAIRAKLCALRIEPEALAHAVGLVAKLDLAALAEAGAIHDPFECVAIARGAFPPDNRKQLLGFMQYCRSAAFSDDLRHVLALAGMSVLEATSYTRKDGQYLRWDGRAPGRGGHFRKNVMPFRDALLQKLFEMAQDLRRPGVPELREALAENAVELLQGSCLDVLPAMEAESVDLVITSPPYCNRYDYTRTYALELAYLGYGETQIGDLRQKLLSATVENRPKTGLRATYSRFGGIDAFESAEASFRELSELHTLVRELQQAADCGDLNNPNVPRMVHNYFREMSVVIHQLARVLRPGGLCYMVNDNVRYAGRVVPVDLILAAIAERAGFSIERIWVLRGGKGNSSQQMGAYGREELRKCVYVWRRK